MWPKCGTAILSKSNLDALASKDSAKEMVYNCIGVPGKDGLLKKVSERHPDIQPRRDLRCKFQRLVVSGSSRRSARGKDRGHQSIFGSYMSPVVLGNRKLTDEPKQEAKTDMDIVMPDVA